MAQSFPSRRSSGLSCNAVDSGGVRFEFLSPFALSVACRRRAESKCRAAGRFDFLAPQNRGHPWPLSACGPAGLRSTRSDLTPRSEEHTSELQSLMRISYAVFCLKKKTDQHI